MVEGQTDQLHSRLGAGTGRHRVTTRVLDLLDQVLVTLLGEATALLRVQVDVVGPHLERGGGVEVGAIVVRQVEVHAHLVVLQGNQGQVQAWVTIEEEQQGQVHTVLRRATQNAWERSHLAVCQLVRLAQEQLGVQAPPRLVVLVNALATDGQLNGRNGTLSQPVGVVASVVGRQVSRQGRQSHVHVADQVTVAGDRDGHAATGSGAAVRRLLDQLHREVRVALVHRLEEGNLGVTRQVNILGTVSYKLHKTTSHFVLLAKKKIQAR